MTVEVKVIASLDLSYQDAEDQVILVSDIREFAYRLKDLPGDAEVTFWDYGSAKSVNRIVVETKQLDPDEIR